MSSNLERVFEINEDYNFIPALWNENQARNMTNARPYQICTACKLIRQDKPEEALWMLNRSISDASLPLDVVPLVNSFIGFMMIKLKYPEDQLLKTISDLKLWD